MERTETLQAFGAVLVGALLVSAGVGLAQFGASPAEPAAANTQPTEQTANDANRTITVSSTGTATTEPDKAVIRLSVESTDSDATVARTNVADNVSQLRDALTELGLDESQIRTREFNLYKDDRHRRGEESEGPVYRARHELVVEVQDIGRVGDVIDTSVDNGASSIRDVQFTVSEETREELRQEALAQAMNKSRVRANTLANSGDLEVVGTKSVSTSSRVRPRHAVQTAAAGDAGGTDLSSGPVGVTVSVQVTYEATENGS